ncbi:MAG: hypothetical protein ACI8WB_004110 [Phenylobacterium sp.]|jgi:hypothetical protein
MKKTNLHLSLTSIALGVTLANVATTMAAPWVDTQDRYLKASITALSNGGVITAPINTYPLMWKSISADLNAADDAAIPEYLRYALEHARHALKHSRKARTSGVKVKVASDSDFQSVGEQHYSKTELNMFNEVIGDSWAVKSSVHFAGDPDNQKHKSFHGSYAAYILGNWVISVDQLSQWWGPGNDSVLALSNNALAFPAVRFTRHLSEPIDFPVLNWLGPVSMTTYFGQQEHSSSVKYTRLWGARINFKPFPSLEIGLTRTSQWGGGNRPNSFSTFGKLLTGQDNAGTDAAVSIAEEPGNQLGGIDFRWSTSLFGQAFGFYGERIGEDEAGGLPSRTMNQLGLETSFGDSRGLYHLFGEYTDTFVNCNIGAGVGNCAYEHHIYDQGYRRYGRSMGSTYDSDAKAFVLGLTHTEVGGHSWYGKVKYLQLNKDNSNRRTSVNPDQFNVHPVSQFAQDRIQLEAGYSLPLMGGLFNAEASVFRSDFKQSGKSDTDGVLRASWEYRF